MEIVEPLIYGKYYHIYNHSFGGRNLFANDENYLYFLKLFDKHLSQVVDTYAWVLMLNHFLLLVRVKEGKEVLKNLNNINHLNLSGLDKPTHQYLSNLFNAYTKAYNKYHKFRGALFEKRFKRKLIDNEEFLKRVIIYIHNNPVHHGFCATPSEYRWSSYKTCFSDRPTKLKHEEVIHWFRNIDNFKDQHNDQSNFANMGRWLEVF